MRCGNGYGNINARFRENVHTCLLRGYLLGSDTFCRAMKRRINSEECMAQAARSGNGQLSLFAPAPTGEARTELKPIVLELAPPRYTVRVCEKGHIVGRDLKRCDQCNAKVLTLCPKCQRPIFLSSSDCSILHGDSGLELRPTHNGIYSCD